MSNSLFLKEIQELDSSRYIVESNSDMIEFAIRKIDEIIKSQFEISRYQVMATLESTKSSILELFEDTITEIVPIFSTIISSNLQNSEKKELIEAYSYSFRSGDEDLKITMCTVGSILGSSLGGMAGSFVGRAAGSAVGAIASRLSANHKKWKRLVDLQNNMMKQHAGNMNPAIKTKLDRLEQEKLKAHAEYLQTKAKITGAATRVGSLVGSIGGSIGGKLAGAA